jgi:hypothetical protein
VIVFHIAIGYINGEPLPMPLDISILVLTMLEDDNSVFAAPQARARGYLLKVP